MSMWIKRFIERLYYKYVLGKLEESPYPPEIQQLILEEAGKTVKGFTRMLEGHLKLDKDRYFIAKSDKERDRVLGSFSRTSLYLNMVKGRINKPTNKKLDEEDLTDYV